MSTTTQSGRVQKRPSKGRSRREHSKLPTLPQDAHVSKRPILHPAIPSPYAGASQQKVVYVSAKTPFMSAVKRVEKLLHASDKRLVQSATRISKDANHQKRMWQREGDDVLNIAREVEAQKRDGNKRRKGPNDDDVASREEVVVKGTGKAISKVMELGLWFQQRDMYEIRLETGSVGAVDDVSYEKEESLEKENGSMDVEPGGDVSKLPKAASRIVQHEERTLESGKTEVNETRIRQLSVLQVYVSLR